MNAWFTVLRFIQLSQSLFNRCKQNDPEFTDMLACCDVVQDVLTSF